MKPWLICIVFCFAAWLAWPAAAQQESGGANEFSDRAEALPFPPDARELEFDATFEDIEFKSASSLNALAAFYRREMARRGWTEDAEEAESDEDSIDMTFRHEGAKVVLELDQWSDDVRVTMDCETLDFSQTRDPAALIAAGVPQSRAYTFLQKELPRPEEIQDVEYRGGDACHFKSPLELQAAFDFYLKSLKSAGWRESRKPIIDSDRRYTEFQRRGHEVSVNIFSDEVGSRIILTYESEVKEPKIPPLAEVADAARPADAPGKPGEPLPEATDKVAIDVSKNTGSSTVTLGSKKYTFKHAAAYRTKDDGEETTRLLFCDRAIPLQKLQAAVAKGDDVSISDLFTSGFPEYLEISLNEYLGFSFSAGGTGIGNSFDDPVNEMTVADGRVKGTLKTRHPMEVFDDDFTISVSIDAAIITPNTRLGGAPAQPAVTARQSPFPDTEPLLPDGAGNIQGEGSKYCKTTRAEVDLPLAAVAAFYRQELAAQDWKEQPADAAEAKATMLFQKTGASLTVTLAGEGEHTTIRVVSNNEAKAKQDGMLPEPGKGRLVMANAHDQAVTITIGKKKYPLKAGQGMDDPKKALNYTVAPAKYTLSIKVAGQPAKTETVDITAGTTWGVVVLPTGEAFANLVYGSAEAE